MIIDFNSYTGSHPALQNPFGADDLLAGMQQLGIDRAVVSDLGDAFGSEGEEDTADVDSPGLIRFRSVKPSSPIDKSAGIKGIRVYPTYQPWDFEGEDWQNLLDTARRNNLVVQISLRLLDPRVMPQAVESQTVIERLKGTVMDSPDVRFAVTGANLAEITGSRELFKLDNLWTDISHIQHPINSLPKLVDLLGCERLLFGTNTPFFYPYTGLFRMIYSGLSDETQRQIFSLNALDLLG